MPFFSITAGLWFSMSAVFNKASLNSPASRTAPSEDAEDGGPQPPQAKVIEANLKSANGSIRTKTIKNGKSLFLSSNGSQMVGFSAKA